MITSPGAGIIVSISGADTSLQADIRLTVVFPVESVALTSRVTKPSDTNTRETFAEKIFVFSNLSTLCQELSSFTEYSTLTISFASVAFISKVKSVVSQSCSRDSTNSTEGFSLSTQKLTASVVYSIP